MFASQLFVLADGRNGLLFVDFSRISLFFDWFILSYHGNGLRKCRPKNNQAGDLNSKLEPKLHMLQFYIDYLLFFLDLKL